MTPPDGRVWPAPAKLNLMLRIVGRRNDGYHLLQTLFQFIDLQDDLWFRPRQDGRLTVSGQAAGIDPEEDLILRAARTLRAAAGVGAGASIRVRKRIPLGGGLGGGSSDAATTLIALNHLWRLGLDRDQLAELGLSLGADVPVFVRGRAAFAEGVGEQLSPLELPERWYLVVDSGCAVATARVFGAAALTRNNPAIKMSDALQHVGENDCLPVVQDLFPQVGAAYEWLAARGGACLSGTGGCVFAVFDNPDPARRLLMELPSPWTGYLVRGFNRHPLLDLKGGVRETSMGSQMP